VKSDIEIRRAGPSDVPLLAEMRVRSYAERHASDDVGVEALQRSSETVFAAALGDGSLRAWLAFDGERPVGTASLMFLPSLPRLGVEVVCDGRVRNVYVEPTHRRRGIALALMRVVLDEAASANVDRLTLGTSDQGRALYERLGFVQKEDELIYESVFDSQISSSP
jgi:GNAT superfamily N-acetyltransferase